MDTVRDFEQLWDTAWKSKTVVCSHLEFQFDKATATLLEVRLHYVTKGSEVENPYDPGDISDFLQQELLALITIAGLGWKWSQWLEIARIGETLVK